MLMIRQEIMGAMAPNHGPALVVIDPFDEARLGANTYDVALGFWYYRTRPPNLGTRVYNPYCEDGVRKLWGEPQQAVSAEVEFRKHGLSIPQGIGLDDHVIIVSPLETVLCHTEEFIGGLWCVAGWMQGKSGWSRSFISVCMDAGLGDIGYVNRWTMEVTNRHPDYAVPLVVGRPIAKIAFLKSQNWLKDAGDFYAGSYQEEVQYRTDLGQSGVADIEEIKKRWKPENMLPRLYKGVVKVR